MKIVVALVVALSVQVATVCAAPIHRTLAFTVAPYGHKDIVATRPFSAPHGFAAHYRITCRVGPGTTSTPGGLMGIVVQPGKSKNMNGDDLLDATAISSGASKIGTYSYRKRGYFRLLVEIQPQCAWSIRVDG
jgi:hypothetical protein